MMTMALPKVEQDVVLGELMNLFRTVGYDGASLAQIAQATGLQKASLYHRFPDGKRAMAKAVLDQVDEWNQTHLTHVLQSTSPPAERLTRALANISTLYQGGQVGCVLRALSLGSDASHFQEQIGGLFADWIAGFERLALDLGHSPVQARQLAQNTLVQVQGSLILARTLNQPALFEQALERIKEEFLP